MDLPGNNLACDSLEDKYNKTYIDIYRRVYEQYTLIKSDRKQATFFKGIVNVTYFDDILATFTTKVQLALFPSASEAEYIIK